MDLISRQETLYELAQLRHQSYSTKMLGECLKVIEKIPSGYEGNWIPCSERMPEDDGYYLVTFQRNLLTRTEQYTSISEFREGSWTEYGHIVAWMPLPESYREVVYEC